MLFIIECRHIWWLTLLILKIVHICHYWSWHNWTLDCFFKKTSEGLALGHHISIIYYDRPPPSIFDNVQYQKFQLWDMPKSVMPNISLVLCPTCWIKIIPRMKLQWFQISIPESINHFGDQKCQRSIFQTFW